MRHRQLSDMQRCEASAWTKFNRLQRILKASTSLKPRLKIYRVCVVQTMLWAAQTWHFTQRRAQRLRGTERRLLKHMIPLPSGVAPANQTKERAKTKSSWISPIFCEFWCFSIGKQARFTSRTFVPGCPCEKFMNWPLFGLVCRGHSWYPSINGTFRPTTAIGSTADSSLKPPKSTSRKH